MISSEEHNFEQKINRLRYEWNKEKLIKEELEYIRKLPFSYEFYMSGRCIRLMHAHPESLLKKISFLNTLEEKREMFKPCKDSKLTIDSDVCIYGHIHTKYVEKIYNRLLINVGSLGNQICTIRDNKFDASVNMVNHAQYVIIERFLNQKEIGAFEYSFIEIPYDIEQELEDNEENIEKDSYEKELRYGLYRDQKNLNKE